MGYDIEFKLREYQDFSWLNNYGKEKRNILASDGSLGNYCPPGGQQ